MKKEHGNSEFVGTKNSQFGSFWITDGSLNKKHRGDIPEGWRRGRIIGKTRPRTEEARTNISKARNDKLRKSGIIPTADKPITNCKVCGASTGTKTKKTCSKECYIINQTQQSQLHPKCGGQKHTHRTKITNNRMESFTSESSYEVAVSVILNNLGIYWTRPTFFNYTDAKGNVRRYYPDFYLPEYNLYLDPKNDYLIRTDTDKIFRTAKENGILIAIVGKDYLSPEGIQELVALVGNAPTHPPCKRGALLLS